MNRILVNRLSNVRLFSTKRFFEIPYDEQWESRDFRRKKLTNENLTINNKFISDE